jgi:phosphohistidine phosphatase
MYNRFSFQAKPRLADRHRRENHWQAVEKLSLFTRTGALAEYHAQGDLVDKEVTAMEIYLMQHGPNLSKDEDPEEPLSPDGKKQVLKAAKAIKKMGLQFDVIIASPKKRSQQTAELVAEAIGFPVERIVETAKVKAMTPAEETIAYLAQFTDQESILIAGHLPSLAEIGSILLTSGSKATIQFERGGLGRIDVGKLPTHEGKLRWYLTPAQLELIAD